VFVVTVCCWGRCGVAVVVAGDGAVVAGAAGGGVGVPGGFCEWGQKRKHCDQTQPRAETKTGFVRWVHGLRDYHSVLGWLQKSKETKTPRPTLEIEVGAPVLVVKASMEAESKPPYATTACGAPDFPPQCSFAE
jgi:hypothetical protein